MRSAAISGVGNLPPPRKEHSSPEPAVSRSSSRFLLPVIAAVFGTPFVCFLQAALGGSLWPGASTFFATGTPLSNFLLWATTVALGSIWLGSSLALGGSPGKVRRGIAAALILVGLTALVIAVRLASSRVLV